MPFLVPASFHAKDSTDFVVRTIMLLYLFNITYQFKVK